MNTDDPVNVNLLQWLNDASCKEEIMKIRTLSGEAYKARKKRLSGITPSGTFKRRSEAGLIEHSGLMQFDVDAQDNPYNMEELKQVIKHAPNVAYLAYSTSGKGLWGLIPIQHVERHKDHFRALYRAFKKKGIIIDKAPSNVASFRFTSYDVDPYFNHNAEVYTHTLEEHKPRSTGRDNRTKVEELISKIQFNRIDITDGYDNWLKVGFALSEEFGESGRSLFHRVSQWHPDYNSRECDVQYDKCLKSNRNGITIASFFHLCKVHGIELTKSDPIHYSQKDRALQGKYEAQENAPYGYNPYTGEIFDERGYPKDWDFHLN